MRWCLLVLICVFMIGDVDHFCIYSLNLETQKGCVCMCVCACACVHVCVCVCSMCICGVYMSAGVHICACICEGQRSLSGIFLIAFCLTFSTGWVF